MNEENTHKLTKIKSTHDNVRTDEIVGYPYMPPKVGKRFSFISFGGGLEIPGDRLITTSIVKVINDLDGKQEIVTENSTYTLERLLSS